MEGVLWKWTNYWNGWQTRWFVLENCVLSYYKSQEEACQGCKGSLKVLACQINVHSLDSTRLDLVIPGKQQICLKAASPQERQLWLVALGSAKACVPTAERKDAREVMPDLLKSKCSELRLYCDLLMQQVHSIKTLTNEGVGPHKENEATGLLSATCDTFINTLEECMALANATSLPIFDPQGIAAPVIPSTPTIYSKKQGRKYASMTSTVSAEETGT